MTATPLILIVEDERAFQMAIAMALSDEGFDVATASNGAAALELLDHIEPDAIVLDIHMPILDGYGFVAAYRIRPGRRAPVIVCSTATPDPRIRSMGARAMLSKPVDLDELVDVVRTCAS